MRRKKSNKLPPFVPIVWDMLNNVAYKSLKPSAAKALPYFLGKFKGKYRDPQRYLYDFTFSYSEGKRYGFSSSTFSKIIQELIGKGFIDPVDRGGLRSDGRSYNRFRLSRRWEQYGTVDFKHVNWKCLQPRIRTKPTSKREMNSFKKGNKRASEEENISQIEAVGSISK
jgi:hypothetical protein